MSSISSSEEINDERFADMIAEEPMYHVLTQFLETEDHINVATLLQELVIELRELRKVLSSSAHKSSSPQ